MITFKRLARGALWNFSGLALPGLVAALAMPRLVSGYGLERFGVLAILWMLVGYFGLFDLGLGRALTQLVSVRLAEREERSLPEVVWAGLTLMGAVGAVLGGALALGAPVLAVHALKLPPGLHAETTAALRLIALGVPVVTVSAGLRGVLEARHDFAGISAIRVAMGTLTYAGPLAVLAVSHSLVPAALTLLAARTVALAAHAWLALRALPALRARAPLRAEVARALLRFGGWMTVSNLVSPIMASLDRLMVGGLFAVGAVAYYATPHELITKLTLVPSALVTVLFPVFSQGLVRQREETGRLFGRALVAVLLALGAVVLVLVCFSDELMTLWMGAEFAERSAPVARWLAAGVLLNGVAFVPVALLHGAGRPDLTAKLHLLELPVYLVAFWGLGHLNGVVGVAQAWSLRVALDALLLLWVARRYIPGTPSLRGFWGALVLVLGAVAAGGWAGGLAARAAVCAAGLVGLVVLGARLLPVRELLAARRATRAVAG